MQQILLCVEHSIFETTFIILIATGDETYDSDAEQSFPNEFTSELFHSNNSELPIQSIFSQADYILVENISSASLSNRDVFLNTFH
jgi:hypothetical protein